MEFQCTFGRKAITKLKALFKKLVGLSLDIVISIAKSFISKVLTCSVINELTLAFSFTS